MNIDHLLEKARELLAKTTSGPQLDTPEALAQSVLQAISEGPDGWSVDVERLKRLLGDCAMTDSKEGYGLMWPGRAEAEALARKQTNASLRPVRERSENFDTTENLYIEGDNLEALKLLLPKYRGRVKVIYIDPPYNTGSDFIYSDDFHDFSLDTNTIKSVNKQEVNQARSGVYHIKWLSMMLPRLRLAFQLLADDGVIFISIDDNEMANLRALCDSIFGSECFVTTLHVQMSTTQGMKVKAAQEGNLVKNAEYVLCYSKDGHKNIAKKPLYDLRERYDGHYSLFLKEDGTIVQLREQYDYGRPKDCGVKKPLKIVEAYARSEDFVTFVHDHLAQIACTDKVTGFDITPEIQRGRWVTVERKGKSYTLTLDETGKIRQLLRLSDSWGKTDGYYGEEGLRKIRGDWWPGFYIDMGNVGKEGNVDFKNGKKPVRLIKQLIQMLNLGDGDIVLDFFSGSATTAHAVMQLNAEDGRTRKFIMVQLQEATPEGSSMREAGYNTICNIGEERIRRAGKQILEEYPELIGKLDVGFRVLEVGTPLLNPVFSKKVEEWVEADAAIFAENPLDPNVKAEDLLIYALQATSIPLTATLRRETIAGLNVWCAYERAILRMVAYVQDAVNVIPLNQATLMAFAEALVGHTLQPEFVFMPQGCLPEESAKQLTFASLLRSHGIILKTL